MKNVKNLIRPIMDQLIFDRTANKFMYYKASDGFFIIRLIRKIISSL